MAIDDVELRPVAEAEFPAFARASARQFGEDLRDAWVPRYRALTELDRTVAAFAGDEIVATGVVNSDRMPVPGGAELASAGVTGVGVRTTHRRRGLLTAMMRRMLDQAAERGEPLAALYASEAPIYGRYGFGPAAPSVRLDVDLSRGGVVSSSPLLREVQLVDPDAAVARFPEIYAAARAQRPGLLDRTPTQWDIMYGADDTEDRGGFSGRYHALLPGRGYAAYRIKAAWLDDQLPDGTLRVTEMVTTDPEATAALWAFVSSVDLVVRVEAQLRPPDDPLPFLLADRFGARTRGSDPMYVRLLDLPTALAARRYAVNGVLVLDVADRFCPGNTGRWRLEGGPDGATCAPSDAAPDLALDTADLATVFLGGNRWSTLAAAGRVAADPATLRRADAMFGWDHLPWNAQIF